MEIMAKAIVGASTGARNRFRYVYYMLTFYEKVER